MSVYSDKLHFKGLLRDWPNIFMHCTLKKKSELTPLVDWKGKQLSTGIFIWFTNTAKVKGMLGKDEGNWKELIYKSGKLELFTSGFDIKCIFFWQRNLSFKTLFSKKEKSRGGAL